MSSDQRPLPEDASHLLEELAGALRTDRLRMFGGAALDLLGDSSVKCHDIDLALPAGSWEALCPSDDIDIIGRPRPYWICHSIPVLMIMARWHGMQLDLNFVDEVSKIGHFDIERVYWEYPNRTFTDPHGVTAEPVYTFQLITPLDSDNPVLLLNRVIKLAAKYSVPFWRQQHLLDLVSHLTAAAESWLPADGFHGPEVHLAHLRAIAGSVRRAKQPRAFLEGCLRTGVLDTYVGPLAAALRRSPSALAQMAGATSDELFWRTADYLVADGSTGWREYRRENRCGSVS